MLTVNIDKPAPAYSLTGPNLANNRVTIGFDGQVSETLTVLQASPDGNRASDTATLTAYSGRAGASEEVASLAITLADLHALPAVTAMVVGEDGKALDPQPEYVAEGKSVMFKVMVLNTGRQAWWYCCRSSQGNAVAVRLSRCARLSALHIDGGYRGGRGRKFRRNPHG